MLALYRYMKRKRQGGTEPKPKPKPKVKLCEHQRVTVDDTGASEPIEFSVGEKGHSETQGHKPEIPKHNVDQILQQTSTSTVRRENEKSCSICKEQKRAARKYRWKLIAGLFFPFALQALDGTIVATALPFIASDFREWNFHC